MKAVRAYSFTETPESLRASFHPVIFMHFIPNCTALFSIYFSCHYLLKFTANAPIPLNKYLTPFLSLRNTSCRFLFIPFSKVNNPANELLFISPGHFLSLRHLVKVPYLRVPVGFGCIGQRYLSQSNFSTRRVAGIFLG